MTKTYRPTIAEVRGDVPWSKLERDLLEECKQGLVAALPGRFERPEDTNDADRRVRAGLIRYLLLGGCDSKDRDARRPHPIGVRLGGAWIDGMLKMEGCVTRLDALFLNCLFPEPMVFRDAEVGSLNLSGSKVMQALNLERLKSETNVMLRSGFEALAGVDLRGAEIGGQLACVGGRFRNPEGFAIDAEAATVGADVLLSGGFEAEGEVNLMRAEIGGQLACVGGRFRNPKGSAINANAATVGADVFLSGGFEAEGEVNLLGAEIGGQLACVGGTFRTPEGLAINAEAVKVGADVFLHEAKVAGQLVFVRADVAGNVRCERFTLDGVANFESARIGEGLFWRQVSGEIRGVDLTEASVGALRDDRESWEAVKALRLGGFRYERLDDPMTAPVRKAWLAKSLNGKIELKERGRSLLDAPPESFDPRPYTQLAKVLMADGQRSMANNILEAREDRLRQAEFDRVRARLTYGPGSDWVLLKAKAGYAASFGFKWLFGYGHTPARVLVTIAGIWVFGLFLYGIAYDAGQMAPNSAVILTSEDWLAGARAFALCDSDCVSPLRAWEGKASYADYETFQSWLYALDLFVPLDALGQEQAWAPSKDRGFWGWLGYYARMPIQMAGWIITAVGAAVLTGLVGRKE